MVLICCTDCLWKANGHISEECLLRIQEETIQASTGVVSEAGAIPLFMSVHSSEVPAPTREDSGKR